ncbi:MAG: DUF881 domain-containing protein [Bacteroidota bacterium]
MLNKKEWQWPVAFVCLCLGFFLAVQLQTQSALNRPTLPTRRIETAMEMLRQIERERDALAEENNSLRKAVAGQASSRASLRELLTELQRAQVLAGLTKVKGPGVVITLSDSIRPARPGEDQDVYLIHADDVLTTVNELRVSGAEAIAVNGQRVVASTAIRCIGSVILVNTVKIAPPIVIEAIGSQNELMQVDMRGGVLDSLRAWGIKVEIVPKETLKLAPYTGSLGATFATPVLEGEG